MAGDVSSALGMMHEQVRPELPRLYQQDDTLWSEIKSRSDIEVVSARPTRVPLNLLSGGKPRVVDPNGGDYGRGSSFVTDAGTLTPVYFAQSWEYTKSAEINTNSDEKAIEDYAKKTMQEAMKEFNCFMESVIQGDGSNTLDTVVSASGQVITVNNANQFRDGWEIDVWTALSGTFRGTATILSVDSNNKQLNLSAAIPAGTTTGDLLLVSGSAGTANSGLFGVQYYQVNSSSGSVMNLARASYPGKLSTPHVSGGSLALTPAVARRMYAQMQIALGIDAPDQENLQWNMNLDMVAQWENVGINVATVIQNQVSGSSSVDMLKKSPPKTFAGRPIIGGLGNIHAKPGRIDGLCLKHWFRCENQPIDYYEVGGQTLFPTYGDSGGISANTLFYLWTGVQVGNDNVRAGLYADTFAATTGY